MDKMPQTKTTAEWEKIFRDKADEIEARPESEFVQPELKRIMADAARSMADDLKAQMEEG